MSVIRWFTSHCLKADLKTGIVLRVGYINVDMPHGSVCIVTKFNGQHLVNVGPDLGTSQKVLAITTLTSN